jgi:hypothetical protein
MTEKSSKETSTPGQAGTSREMFVFLNWSAVTAFLDSEGLIVLEGGIFRDCIPVKNSPRLMGALEGLRAVVEEELKGFEKNRQWSDFKNAIQWGAVRPEGFPEPVKPE